MSEDIFDENDWLQHFGDVGEAPELPSAFLSRKGDTFFCLIPKTVNGKRFTLEQLAADIMKKPRVGGKMMKCNIRATYGHEKEGAQQSCWVEMTKECMAGTFYERYMTQKGLVERAGFEVPNVLELATVFVCQLLKTGRNFFTEKWTWTCSASSSGSHHVFMNLRGGDLNIYGHGVSLRTVVLGSVGCKRYTSGFDLASDQVI